MSSAKQRKTEFDNSQITNNVSSFNNKSSVTMKKKIINPFSKYHGQSVTIPTASYPTRNKNKELDKT